MSLTYAFGKNTIFSSQIFMYSKYCFGFVNLKPVLPGHVLVASFRVVQRFSDLTSEEVSDMYISAQKIGKIVEREYNGTSLSLVMQDGPEAGQTVPHCHVHIIPRKVGDFVENDDIYKEINKSTRVDNEEREPRSLEEMDKEATHLRQFF
ncbi:hypothetical protein Glove_225g64 [Diversispora epigaea]|uniref:Bis(5'-adenosyl)-triphosphatase n=1 Tax=Diversispora epigaea TaxID=1348612 RepID=A0A397IKT5_9GLOM|nr:hypothetical protein Glove_225g64 [Diversispora epigaea]